MERSEILVVGGSSAAAGYIQGLVSSCSVPSVPIASWSEARKIVGETREKRFHAAVVDLDETPADGRRFLADLHREAPFIPVIVVTGGVNVRGEWVTAGAFEVLTKPLSRAAMLTALNRAVTRSQLCAADGLGLAKPAKRSVARPLPEIIGDSEAMQEVYYWISKVARSDANVCLYGDSGTGKELVARAIHETGRRRGRPFVVFDCAAIPEGLMESEMFGHVRGAFTSAVGDRIGVFQLADTGTLFLDEVAELPLPLQAKLLRLIQNREFRRVGSNHPIRVDVRILTATNRDLAALVKAGHFREDLFYRLDVMSIKIPPLRERKEDIPLLVDHFVQQLNQQSDKQIRGVTAGTLRLLVQYDWPGNVRELRNCIERAGVMADTDFIDIVSLRQVLHPVFQTAGSHEPGGKLSEMEKALILDTLRQTRGNKTAAASLLGISLRGLHYKLKRIKKDGIRARAS